MIALNFNEVINVYLVLRLRSELSVVSQDISTLGSSLELPITFSITCKFRLEIAGEWQRGMFFSKIY